MKTYRYVFERLISPENLERAYQNARRHKTQNPHVQEFDRHWQLNLAILHRELKTRTYKPQPLKTFILRDPKTRKICVSDFRDRVVHHALVNVLQQVFEPRFIHDSYASRMGKGTLPAIRRFETFLRRVTRNGKQVPEATNANLVRGYALKADIRQYFDTVNHQLLLNIIAQRVKDDGVRWLTGVILDNYHTTQGNGMPLGNWTSQFFANTYLNELDQFVKHRLKAKYYIRYVDDFVILHESKSVLQEYEQRIKTFLQMLKLELHPDKCRILPLGRGVALLGYRVFYCHKLVRQRNIRKIVEKLSRMITEYALHTIEPSAILDTLQGWNAYAMHADTHKLRQSLSSMVKCGLHKIHG
jgi:retron-type reverse transcriptase